MKYKVGDRIIFRADLVVDEAYDDYYYTEYMNRKIVKNERCARITHVYPMGDAFPPDYRVDIFDGEEIIITDAMIAGLQPMADISAILDILEV